MKMNRLALAALATVLTAAPLASPAAADPVAASAPSYDASRLEVVYINRTTQRRIGFGTPSFALVGAFPRMDVEVHNPTTSERRYQYLVEWFGQDGVKQQTSAVWQDVFLLPNQRQTLRSMGQLAEAYSARITIREVAKNKPALLPY
jgi:uncharacterized protein YcfL